MNDERTQRENAALLLKDAAILYERHGAGRPEPFNVFDVLFEDREVKHEVNHSRFLAALLDHRKPGEERAANLDDFIKEFASKPLPNFAPDGAKVERERWHIDILITNDRGQTLAIENKICAGDQHRQLKRYHEKLVKRGYKDVHILYLAIDGRDPSKDSVGDLDEKDYTSISYECILGWLKRCRKRACDEPELRETIAQYSRLIEKLTDKGRSELMNELKDLCLRDNNLLAAHHLAEALTHAKASLMHSMWKKIKGVLAEHFGDPVDFSNAAKNRPSDISEDRIRRAIEDKRGPLAGWFGLYYPFGQEPAYLGIKANIGGGIGGSGGGGFFVGVRCDQDENKEKYYMIRSKLASLESKFGRGDPDESWPWWCILKSGGTGLQPGDIEKLADEEARNELTDYIVKSAVEQLIVIRDTVDS